MLRTALVGIVMAFIAAGCTATSPVVPFGKDTYNLTTRSEFGLAKAKSEALQEANAYCSQKGMVMMPVNSQSTSETGYGMVNDTFTNYDFTFRCLSEDDPDFDRTEFDRPDVVIENR